MALGEVHWRALVNAVMTLRVARKTKNVLTGLAITNLAMSGIPQTQAHSSTATRARRSNHKTSNVLRKAD